MMKFPWETVSYLQNFFQLQFLFSGLEISSSMIFAARILVLLAFGIGALWISYRIVMKVLDCLQTLLASLAPVPKTFYLLLFLVIPLWPDSAGAKWMGYILLVLALLGLGLIGVLFLVLWKYGVEHAVRLINTLRYRAQGQRTEEFMPSLRPETVLRPVQDAPPVRSETGPLS
jgi:hypothetical protein